MALKTTVIWGCTGMDTAELSYRLAKAESEKGKTLVVELPCLGIPRLGFAANVMDRIRNVESVIMKTEQKIPLNWEMIHSLNEQLGILTASVFATPDSPMVSKVNLSTLIGFVQCIKDFAEKEKCRHLIFDCQGQLTSPMTFFALKAADSVVIPIGKPADAAYVLANVHRLVGTFQYPIEKFVLLVEGDARAVRQIASIKGGEGKPMDGIKILSCGQDLFDPSFQGRHGDDFPQKGRVESGSEKQRFWKLERIRPRPVYHPSVPECELSEQLQPLYPL